MSNTKKSFDNGTFKSFATLQREKFMKVKANHALRQSPKRYPVSGCITPRTSVLSRHSYLLENPKVRKTKSSTAIRNESPRKKRETALEDEIQRGIRLELDISEEKEKYRTLEEKYKKLMAKFNKVDDEYKRDISIINKEYSKLGHDGNRKQKANDLDEQLAKIIEVLDAAEGMANGLLSSLK